MTMPSEQSRLPEPLGDAFAALSEEVRLSCDRDGIVRWANALATQLFGECIGRPMAALSLDATHARACFDRVLAGDARSFEMALAAQGVPRTFVFRGRAVDTNVLLVGTPVADVYVHSLREVDGVMRELGELHRETDRQRRELEKRNDQLLRLNEELTESHLGLVSLHAEIEDKSHALQRESDIKGRVVANVSHEFRTPLNSILGLSQLLLDGLDGRLNSEQEKQVRFIRGSAQSLSELVNDLLDLSRIESGKANLRVQAFHAQELLAALRGMMRPLVATSNVELVIEDAGEDVPLESDEGKISQILRNLVSNALKFTEKGEVRVSMQRHGDDDTVSFTVKDTGIGISRDDLRRVFQEFVQIDSPIQRRVRGTGLGLSLSRKLAELLGGTLSVESKVGEGSTFTLRIPRVHLEQRELATLVEHARKTLPGKVPVLVVEDHRQTLFLYEKYLTSAGFQTLPARSIDDARKVLETRRPAAIVLDVMLEGESTWRFLSELKENERTRNIPVMVVTVVDRAQKARALGADEFWLKPIDPERLLSRLSDLSRKNERLRVLVIDDDEASRYMIRRLLEGTPYEILEAADGRAGIDLAREQAPHIILLDFVLGDQTAFDVLDDLKLNPVTRGIPVIIQTAKTLDQHERERLERETAAILSKQNLSRELAIARIREALTAAGLHEGVPHG